MLAIKNNTKLNAVILSLVLFSGLVYWIFTITQTKNNFKEPVVYTLSDEKVLNPINAYKTILLKKDSVVNGFFNPGFTKHKWWIYLNVPSQVGDYLQIANPHINKIRIYTIHNEQPLLAYESGDYFKFSKRVLSDPDFWFQIPSLTSGLLVEVDKKGESLDLPIRLVAEREMTQYLSDQKMAYGIFTGWMIFLILLNLFLWASLRDNIHFFYILFVGSSALWVIANWGLGFQYFWPDYPAMASKARPLFSTSSFIFILELARRYFAPIEKKPLYNGFTRALQIVLLLLFFIFLISNIALSNEWIRYLTLSAANILWLLSTLTVLFLTIKSYKTAKALSLFFLAAFIAHALFSSLIILSQYNVQENWVFFINKYGSAIGILANSTILSFGLTQRYNYYKKEREQVQQELAKERSLQADRLIQAQEEERSRLARELHDGLGGLLGSIRIGAFNKLKLDNANQTWLDTQLSEAIDDLRNIAHDLMPVNLPEKGLVSILEKTVARWNLSNEFKTHLDCAIHNRYPLPVEAGLYRIVSELIHNVKKHAHATEVFISLWEEKNTQTITLLVEDNGTGFISNQSEGIGLKNIRYRVEYLGGKILIDSNTKGTSIVIEISGSKTPLHAQ
ncbi:MAG TPA: 7TM diverse intracellular signaling domain-containing protein [Sediminibacterium sp.]|nr:7TM diverse intracellular signaling domain-containing protein [Sediminibacterium sp.]